MSFLRRDTNLVPRVAVLPPDEDCNEEFLDDDTDVSTLFGMPQEAKTAPPMPAAPNVGLWGVGARAHRGISEDSKSVHAMAVPAHVGPGALSAPGLQ